ncbi:hypothetical protein FSP39_020138 [Pinctada imbricata]|uniref:Uncharacterized protein n=1 Tax=Pinctada imbricata TaxID=66713 RepID=A0AA88XN51_PINIB|nr:hypothetical protein FSP39_020138 [Pinctada imbricata]
MSAFGDLIGMACFACIVVGQLIPGVLSTFSPSLLNVGAPLQHFPIHPPFVPHLPWMRPNMPIGPVQVPLPRLPLNRLLLQPGMASPVNRLPIIPTPLLHGYQRHLLPRVTQPVFLPTIQTGNMNGGPLMPFAPKLILHRPPLSPLSMMIKGGGVPPVLRAPQIPLLRPIQGGLYKFMPSSIIQRPLLHFLPRVLPRRGLLQPIAPIIRHRPLLPIQPRILPGGSLNAPFTFIQGQVLPSSPMILPGTPPLAPTVQIQNTLLSQSPRLLPGGDVPQLLPSAQINRIPLLHPLPAFGRGLPRFQPSNVPFITRQPVIPIPQVFPNLPRLPLPTGPQIPLIRRLPLPPFPLPGQSPQLIPNAPRPLPLQPILNGISPLPLPLNPVLRQGLPFIQRLPPPIHAGDTNSIMKLSSLPNCEHSASPQIQGALPPLATPPPLSISSAPGPIIRPLAGINMAGHNTNASPMPIRLHRLFISDIGSEKPSTETVSDSQDTKETGNVQETIENSESTNVPSLDQNQPIQEDVKPVQIEIPSFGQMSVPGSSPQLNGLEFLLQRKRNNRF